MIEQSDSKSETSDHPPPVFVLEGENGAAQTNEDNESINAPEGAPPNIPFVESDDSPVASDCASVADFHNSDVPDPEHLFQSN